MGGGQHFYVIILTVAAVQESKAKTEKYHTCNT